MKGVSVRFSNIFQFFFSFIPLQIIVQSSNLGLLVFLHFHFHLFNNLPSTSCVSEFFTFVFLAYFTACGVLFFLYFCFALISTGRMELNLGPGLLLLSIR
jgi:hypothetical protein